FFPVAKDFAGSLTSDLMQWVIVTGSFACALAFHNAISRYFFAMGREGVLPRALGRTHPHWRSPYIASFTQTAIATCVVYGFWLAGQDPYLALYAWPSIITTLAVLVIQAICCVAVVRYYRKAWPQEQATAGGFLRTVVAPVVGLIAQAYVIY